MNVTVWPQSARSAGAIGEKVSSIRPMSASE
jgi:hypothetical protein